MPEPGFNNFDFDDPMNNSPRRKAGVGPAGKRLKAKLKLPREFANFRLKDGRRFADVMGDAIFGPNGGPPLAEKDREALARGAASGGAFAGNPRFDQGPAAAKGTLGRGNALISSTSKDASEGIGAPSGQGMPGGDNEAEFTNLPFGPEEGGMAAGSSVSGQRSEGGEIENPGRRPEQAEKPVFTSADILDPQDRQEFENLGIAMESAIRKIALHEDRLGLLERRFKNERIDARAISRARRYFEFRIGRQEALIARNEKRMAEIHADALLDSAALSPGDTPRAEDAGEDGAPVFPTARPRTVDRGGWQFIVSEDEKASRLVTAGYEMEESDSNNPDASSTLALDSPEHSGEMTSEDVAGAPTSLLEAFDRVDAGDSLEDMGFVPEDYPSPSASAHPFMAAIQDYINATPDEQTKMRVWAVIGTKRQDNFINGVKAGGDYMPTVFLEKPDFEEFNSNNSDGVRAVQGDDEVSFGLGDGPAFLTLPDDAAAVLVRNWDDFKPRLGLLSRLFAEDLPPEDMRRLIEAEVYKDIPESERGKPTAMKPDGTMYAFDDPYGGERFMAQMRMRAFDELVEGIRGGATDEEITGLIGDFQQIMLPELMGVGRFLREFVKDIIPGLNNVRSGIHFWNDLIEIEEEWKEGDVTGLAGNSLLLVLDGLGMIPIVGSAYAPVRSGLKKGARAVGKAAPRLDALVAQAQVWKHARQWSNLDHKIDPLRIFGPTVKNLPPDVVKALGRKANWIVGGASQGYLQGLLRRMDPAARAEVTIANHDIVPGATMGRRYDMAARDATAILIEDIAGWLGHRFGDFRAQLNHFEFKAGGGIKARSQELIDNFANAHPGQLLERGGAPVTNVRDIRIFPQQIPIEYAIADAGTRLGQLVNRGVIDEVTSVALLNGMIAESKRGTKLIGLFDYAGMFVNLLAAGSHRTSATTSGRTAEGGED